MLQQDTYQNYFSYLTEQHPAMAEQAATGSTFAMMDIEDSFGDLRIATAEKGYIFRLFNYTYQVDLVGGENNKLLVGGWIVAHYFGARRATEADYAAALAKAELINDEFIERIIHDNNAGHPLWNYSYPDKIDINVQPVRFTGDASYCGYRTIISWSNYFRVCLSDPAAPEWLDGGNTPTDL